MRPVEPHIFKPKLRLPLNISLQAFEQSHGIVIQCPLGVTERPLILIPELAPILAKLDGSASLDDLADRFEELGARRQLLLDLVTLLDQYLFLESPEFLRAEAQIRLAFLESPLREAALAGAAYSADPKELRRSIESYLSQNRQSSMPLRSFAKKQQSNLDILVTPHIDYQRGWQGYAQAFSAIANRSYDLVILIGTSHQYSELLFHLTRKDFASPLGVLPNATYFSDELISRYGARSIRDEYLHKKEHSLELSLPFIQLTLGVNKIVPILVGSFHHLLDWPSGPHEFEPYHNFVESLSYLLDKELQASKRVLIIAAVDMAHVGQHFGDSTALTAQFLEEVRQRDQEYLELILAQDRSGLWSHISSDLDARRICGFPTLYTVLDLVDKLGVKLRGELLGYHQAVNYRQDCAVTYAAALLSAIRQ